LSEILKNISEKYSTIPQNNEDGVKLFFNDNWVHLRGSNTEPIIRIYSEAENETVANELAQQIMTDIKNLSTTIKA
jgi:phosphomannomutase